MSIASNTFEYRVIGNYSHGASDLKKVHFVITVMFLVGLAQIQFVQHFS